MNIFYTILSKRLCKLCKSDHFKLFLSYLFVRFLSFMIAFYPISMQIAHHFLHLCPFLSILYVLAIIFAMFRSSKKECMTKFHTLFALNYSYINYILFFIYTIRLVFYTHLLYMPHYQFH